MECVTLQTVGLQYVGFLINIRLRMNSLVRIIYVDTLYIKHYITNISKIHPDSFKNKYTCDCETCNFYIRYYI